MSVLQTASLFNAFLRLCFEGLDDGSTSISLITSEDGDGLEIEPDSALDDSDSPAMDKTDKCLSTD